MNATTGEVVANISSYSDHGIMTAAGVIFPSETYPVTWSADGHFASVSSTGIR